MKPTEISIQIVKNLGNYESVRLQVNYTLEENEQIENSFVNARIEIENAFLKAFPKSETSVNVGAKKEILTIKDKDFQRIVDALLSEKTTIQEIENHYEIDREVLDYFKKQNIL